MPTTDDNNMQPETQPQLPPEMTNDDFGMEDGNDGLADDGKENIDNEKNGEIDDIFSKLDTEKQAAVIKYAKSMINDADENNDEDGMVTEITNNVLDDIQKKEIEKNDKKIRNKKVTTDNPFVSKRFKK